MSNENKETFIGWVYRSYGEMSSCSKRRFESRDDAILYGKRDENIVKIVTTNEDGENETVIYKAVI